jgi:hypothetical protein
MLLPDLATVASATSVLNGTSVTANTTLSRVPGGGPISSVNVMPLGFRSAAPTSSISPLTAQARVEMITDMGTSQASEGSKKLFPRYGGNWPQPGTSDGSADEAGEMVHPMIVRYLDKCPTQGETLVRVAEEAIRQNGVTGLTKLRREIDKTLHPIDDCQSWGKGDQEDSLWEIDAWRWHAREHRDANAL